MPSQGSRRFAERRRWCLTIYVVAAVVGAGWGRVHFAQADAPTTLQASVPIQLVEQVGGATQAVAVDGPRAYVGEGRHLVILDVSAPGQPPAVLGRSPLLEGEIRDLAVTGSMAFIAAYDAGFYVIDVSNPSVPVVLAQALQGTYSWSVSVSGAENSSVSDVKSSDASGVAARSGYVSAYEIGTRMSG